MHGAAAAQQLAIHCPNSIVLIRLATWYSNALDPAGCYASAGDMTLAWMLVHCGLIVKQFRPHLLRTARQVVAGHWISTEIYIKAGCSRL